MNIYDTITTAQLNALFGGKNDTINLYGTLSNSGTTLNVGPGTSFPPSPALTLENGSTISGGTVVDKGDGLAFNGGTLDGVTYDGTLDVEYNAAIGAGEVFIANGLTVHGVNGTGNGTIDVGTSATNGYFSSLVFDNTQTIDNATINLGNAANSSYGLGITDYDTSGAGGQVLTLGTNLTVNAADTNNGYGSYIGFNPYVGG